MKKKLLIRLTSLGLAVIMASGMTACNKTGARGGKGGSGEIVATEDVEKPEKIKMTFDTCMTFENGVDEVCKKYTELTGIGLELEKPDHAKYYEKISLAFASGDESDVIEMGSTYYPQNANDGLLWDMTEAWEKSTNPAKDKIDEQYVDALKIDGALYGFPTVAGNGTVTYVRKDLLDKWGVDMPKNYDEFIKMLEKFKAEGYIPLTAAGLLNNGETPYDIYLREFYQDAIPDFYQKEDGTWVDGFSEPAMIGAMTRFKDAYAKGLIDGEVVTNKTSTCRDKFNAGLVGCFNYWAGMWCAKLEDATPGATLAAMPAIEEVKKTRADGIHGYIERVPTAMIITDGHDNPQGIFENFILYSHDGGEGQMLFTHGVEGVHYTNNGDGTCTALPYKEDPEKLVEKAFYAPELTISEWEDPIELDQRVSDSLEVFRSDREFAKVPPASDVVTKNLANLNVVKGQVMANVIHGNITPEQGIAKYNEEAGKYVEDILNDLNAKG